MTLDCGHPPTPHPGAIARYDDATCCYGCAFQREYPSFLASDSYLAYLTLAEGDNMLTTWTGGLLAWVTQIRVTKHRGFGGRHHFRMHFRAVAPDGSRWYGSGRGHAMFCRVHRAKTKKVEGEKR